MKSVIFTFFVFVACVILSGRIASGEAPDAKSLIELKCTGCHSLLKITSKKKSPEEWTATVKRMRALMEKKGRDQLNDDEEKTITAYLAKEYSK